MTHNTREVEEWEKEFENRFGAFTFNNGGTLELTLWDVVDERIHPTNEVGFEIYIFIHHHLQKTRHDWLREEIVMLKDRQRGWLGNEEDGSDRHPNYDELQTIIDRYHSELDQDKK